jgi:hypothetical protein
MVDHVLAQTVRKRMDLAPTVSNKVNVVRAVQCAGTPGHKDHLHDVGDSQVIAANHLDVAKCRPPGLTPLIAMHETFVPTRLRANPCTNGHGIGGETSEHALLAPDPAEVLDAMHRHPSIVAPGQPGWGMPLRPHGTHAGWDRLADLGWILVMPPWGQLLDPVLDPFHDGMTGVAYLLSGIRNPIDQPLGDVLVALVITMIDAHSELLPVVDYPRPRVEQRP